MAETALAGLLRSNTARKYGDETAAMNHLRAALDATWDDDRMVLRELDISIYLDDVLDWFHAYVTSTTDDNGDPHIVAIVSEATYETLNYEAEALERFVDDMRAGGPGMKLIMRDVGPFAAAIKAQAKDTGTDVTMAKDALTDLDERTESLLIQAASLNKDPAPIVRQSFAIRYVQLQADHKALTERLAKIEAKIELAGVAMFEL